MIPVNGFPQYLVNEKGEVYSVRAKKILKPNYNTRGYASVEFWNAGKRTRKLIHRIVAETFIPNPDGLPQVNHIDENPKNNEVSNLEWCTAKYNMNYGNGAKTRHSKIDYSRDIFKINAVLNGKKACKPVLMFTKEGCFISEFESLKEAERMTGINSKYISNVICGKTKTAKGYVWKLKEGSDDL